jgi:hypothetical protein
MKILLQRIDNFVKNGMVKAFIRAESKHPHDSATDDSIDWGKWPWDDIEAHFWRHVDHVKEHPRQPRRYASMANMSFLMWFYYKFIAPEKAEAD